MLDVHPPHETAHTWKDFLIHIATIVVGLLIAIGLEQSVEFYHHRHLLHVAEADLHTEIANNQDLLKQDERQLDGTEAELQQDIAQLIARKSDPKVAEPLNFSWQWSSMEQSAWITARDSGALTLMPYETEQNYSAIYGQQGAVNDQAKLYIRSIYLAGAPLKGRTFAQLSPAELDETIAAVQHAIVDLDLLRDLCNSLKVVYAQTAGVH